MTSAPDLNLHFYLKHFPADGTGIRGGTATAVHGLAAGCVRQGMHVTILCEHASESVTETEAGYTIRCFDGSANRNPFFVSPELIEYLRQLHAKPKGSAQPLVVLGGLFSPPLATLSRLFTRIGLPYVASPYDPYSPALFSKNPHLKWPYWIFFEKRILRGAKAVQVLDPRHEKFLKTRGIDTPVFPVPCGITESEIAPDLRITWSNEGIVRLIFVGRIDRHNKGLDLLLKALVRVQQHFDARLVIQGPDWGDRRSLTRLASKLGVADKVSFREPDFDRTAAEIISEHDIFCLPSRFEGFGLAALEAMVAQRVLLVTEIAGVTPHAVSGGCGVAVEPTVSSIVQGLVELVSRRQDWPRMGKSGRRYVSETLTWNSIAKNAIEDYRKCVSVS